MDFEELLHKVIDIVKSCKGIISYNTVNITKKGDNNFVTNVDKSVEACLSKELTKVLPNSYIVSEEQENNYANLNEEYCWVIDPIDGTTNFISGYAYSISVGLKVKGVTTIGVVYCPFNETLYYSLINKGAYKVNSDNKIQKLMVDENVPSKVFLFGVPYNRNKLNDMLKIVCSDNTKYADLKRIGPASLDVCRVAENSACVYIEYDLKIWDYCAAALILEEANGAYRVFDDLCIFGNKQEVKKYEYLKDKNCR